MLMLKRIGYCAVCGQRIQWITRWKHQRPRPDGQPHNHKPRPRRA